MVAVVVVLLGGVAHAETFEGATYTIPAGWKAVPGGLQRTGTTGGVGVIRFIPGHAASTRGATAEFTAMWNTRVVPELEGARGSTAAPAPESGTDGDMTILAGGTAVVVQKVELNVVLTTIIGRGRVFGIASIAAGDPAVAEVIAFYDAVTFGTRAATPAAVAPTVPAAKPATLSRDLEFKLPPGYAMNGGFMMPSKPDASTPCIYAIGPTRASSGSLETDAKGALGTLGDWKIKWADRFEFRRGISGGGWAFYWVRTTVTKGTEEANAMTMAIAGANGQTHIVYGMGGFQCLLEDASFMHLFHSLRVPGASAADGSKQIAGELAGNSWRMTTGSYSSGPSGMIQYTFSPNGRYWYGYGVRTQMAYTETTTTSVGDGSWTVKDGVLVLTPDRKDRGVQRIPIRLYDWPIGGSTVRSLGWFTGSSELQYFRVGS